MSVDLSGFNAEEVEPDTGFDPMPAGWYSAMITDSEMKTTKNGAGQYLQLRLDIIDGEHKGRVLFDRLNLINQNQTAVDIAQRTLSAICRAVGIMQPKDSSDLHDKPIRVKVSVRPAQGGYEATNEVKGYQPLDVSSSGGPAPVSAAGASAGAPKKPWQ